MRLGFALDDVRRLTMTDFVAFTDVCFGEGGRPERAATQADIDAFMS